MVDVYEQGTGGGTSGSGDDNWGTGYQDKGCWGTITVTKGSEQTVYANFPVVNEDKVKCYKWSSKGSPAFSITSKNWNKCVVKGEFTGFTGSSSRLYCYMEYGTNSFQAYYDINVTAPTVTLVSNISLNKESVSLLTEETTQLTPTISPSNATYKTVTWASDNIDVATVSSNGLVKAVGEGSATITCRATDGSGVIATCKITVKKPVPPTGIIVSPSSMNINIGDTKTISYSLTPTDATTTVTWKSDNTSIATVSSSGLVKGIAEGKTTIRVTTSNGKTASCEVTVKKVEATSISLPSTKTVYIGETVTLTYTMTPSNATNSVTWKSADTDIATVSSSGVVTGKKEGSTNITVTTDNGKSASCMVYVESKPIEPTKITLPTSCNVEVGYSTKMRYTLEPENATTTITWKSSDTSIATVSSDGIVKGIKQGSAKITATTDNGLSADIWVYIGGFKEGTIFYGTTSEDYDVTYKVTDINANTCAVIRCEKTAKRIVIPSSVQGYKVTSIKQASFSQCEIEEISLPNSLTTIGTQAFSWCKSLKSISIPNSVTSIEEKSFQYCEKLESVVLSNNMKRIEHWLFWECTSLLNVSGYNNIEYIDIGAFNKTPWLANLPDGENYIGKVLLTYKGKMPANTTIKIKDGCTQIAGSAFSNQVGLVAITIPSSLVILDSNPFAGCTNLTSFKVMSKEPIKINEDVFFVETDSIHTFDQTTLCVPKGTKVKYQEADVWKNFKNIVEFDPTGIDDITVDEDGQQTIYSISGIRLKRPQKGLNIINGKKVVVR